MKNFRFLILVLVFGVVISCLLFFLKRDKSYHAKYNSDNELLELEKRYNKKPGALTESSEKNKGSSLTEKQNKIKNKWGSEGSENEENIADNSDSDASVINKNKSVSANSSNDFFSDKLGLNNGTSFSDSKNKENTLDKISSTNSQNNLNSIQAMLDNLPSRSNDFIVKLDNDINGLEINVTGREARVSAELLNSDLFENGAFSNAPGIWITGLNKYKEAATFEKLWYDYKNRFIEIPGVGIYLMKDKLSDEAFAERKIEILNELISEKPNDNLYEQLAKTYADAGDIATAEKTINTWAENSENVNYEYEMAEIYRLNGENLKNSETSQEYLQKAVDYYEQAGTNPDIKAKSAINLAKTYEKLGDINSAINTLENSYDYEKSKRWQDDVAVRLGEYYSKTGDDYAALDWYEKSPQPGYINKERRGQIYEKIGDDYSAIKNYEESVKFKRNDKYSPLLRLGRLYSRTGNQSKMNETYKRLNKQLDKLTKKRRDRIKSYPIYNELKRNLKTK